MSSPAISLALPVTMLMTPGGMPACSASTAMASAEKGVCEAGLTTMVHPAASAGPSLRASMALGKFQGVMAAVTPMGWRSATRRVSALAEGITSP
ncbi:hypothetical protein FQZ97_1273850 [compost metagenome]